MRNAIGHIDRGDGLSLCGLARVGAKVRKCMWCVRYGAGPWFSAGRVEHRERFTPRCHVTGVSAVHRACWACEFVAKHHSEREEKKIQKELEAERTSLRVDKRSAWPNDWGKIPATAKP